MGGREDSTELGKHDFEKTTASQNSKVTTSAIPFYCDCDYLYP